MDVAVLGSGAMGTLFGARLALAGHRVSMIDIDQVLLAKLNRHGLCLEADDGVHRVAVRAGVARDFKAPVDLLVVFTKSMHSQAAMADAAHLLNARTLVLTVQNGLGNVEAIEAHVPRERIARGMTNLPVDLQGPGHAASHGIGEVRIFGASGAPDARITALARTLEATGLCCVVDESVLAAIWEKVAFNAALNAIAALTRLSVGAIGSHPRGVALARSAAAEALRVAVACGVEVDQARVDAALDHAFDQHRDHLPSMLQDVLAGRRTEVDHINGAIIAEADRRGVEAPVNRTLHGLVTLLHRP
jgi:2-dehydropantoate 2-reductase